MAYKKVETFKKRIAWLDRFIKRWDALDDIDVTKTTASGANLYSTEKEKLCVRLEKWCTRNGMDPMMARELRRELRQQMARTSQGKF